MEGWRAHFGALLLRHSGPARFPQITPPRYLWNICGCFSKTSIRFEVAA
jgi:hypothetical protein